MTFLTNLTFLGSSLDDAALADSFPILETLFAMGKKTLRHLTHQGLPFLHHPI